MVNIQGGGWDRLSPSLTNGIVVNAIMLQAHPHLHVELVQGIDLIVSYFSTNAR